jgi:metacaspase-1
MPKSSFDKQVEKEIPAIFYMFAGADDAAQSQEVDNVGTFALPDPAGKHGGACTAALLQVVYNDEADDTVDLSWTETLALMREKIAEIGLTSVPCLSSSRPIDVNETMQIVPDGYEGTKRAMLIGINYVGQKGELKACWNGEWVVPYGSNTFT